MSNRLMLLRSLSLFVTLMGGWTINASASSIDTTEESTLLHPNMDDEIEVIVPKKLFMNYDDSRSNESYLRQTDDGRSLQVLCAFAGYQNVAQIRTDLKMSYTVLSDRIKVEVAYNSDNGWIGLGTNPSRPGKMVGAEAWVGLPGTSTDPVIYNLNSKVITGITPSTRQSLEGGEVIQEGNGQTILRFEKLLNDGNNVSIDGDGEIVFIWAVGVTNTFGQHLARGAFRITLETCTGIPNSEPQEVPSIIVCGYFGLGIFCPFSPCGIIGRLRGLCPQ